MIRKVLGFFDKLEDKIRGFLSHYPILYAVIGGTGVVLFWRGVWQLVDGIPYSGGLVSAIAGMIILGMTGVLVSSFIGNRILLTGLQGKKKLTEMDPQELETEEMRLEKSQKEIKKEIDDLESKLSEVLKDLEKKQN